MKNLYSTILPESKAVKMSVVLDATTTSDEISFSFKF